MNKSFLEHYMKTKPETTEQKYLFLVDNLDWSYVKKKYKLNVTNFPFFVIVNSLSLLRPFPSFSDIVPHIHLEMVLEYK